MIFQKTKIKGLYIIVPEIKADKRGYFTRIFCKDELEKNGINFDIKQSNLSLTIKKNTIRGLHFQKNSKSEAKIVRCLRGEIYDVAVDLRKNSPTYRQWLSVKLNNDNKKMLLIPKGFAHGFQTLTDNCEAEYFMSEFYDPEESFGVRWDDPLLNINWPNNNPFLNERDASWPLLIEK